MTKSGSIVDDLIKSINSLSGKYSPYMIFSDWVEMSALSVCNSFSLIEDTIWKDREQQYLAIAAKYDRKELDTFYDMLGMLALALEEKLSDVLGGVFMQARLGSQSGRRGGGWIYGIDTGVPSAIWNTLMKKIFVRTVAQI